MPYSIRKIGKNRYQVYNTATGEIHSKGTTKKKAEGQFRLLQGVARKDMIGLEGGVRPRRVSVSEINRRLTEISDTITQYMTVQQQIQQEASILETNRNNRIAMGRQTGTFEGQYLVARNELVERLADLTDAIDSLLQEYQVLESAVEDAIAEQDMLDALAEDDMEGGFYASEERTDMFGNKYDMFGNKTDVFGRMTPSKKGAGTGVSRVSPEPPPSPSPPPTPRVARRTQKRYPLELTREEELIVRKAMPIVNKRLPKNYFGTNEDFIADNVKRLPRIRAEKELRRLYDENEKMSREDLLSMVSSIRRRKEGRGAPLPDPPEPTRISPPPPPAQTPAPALPIRRTPATPAPVEPTPPPRETPVRRRAARDTVGRGQYSIPSQEYQPTRFL
jgi:hypothetical protein